jgi:hypothetical protein
MPPARPTDSGPVPTFPFDVTLLPPDRMSYAMREPMTFELLLKNTSREPVDVPWSTDGSLFDPKMPGARRLSILLTFKHEVTGVQDFAFQTTFGADPVPGSLRTVHPNETVLIRAGSPVELLRTWSGPLEWSYNVKIKARVMFSVPSRYYLPGMSGNDIGVELRSK